jgi:hypothetical protein
MATQHAHYTIDEVAKRGTELYETKIRRLVEEGNIDRFLAIDVVSGDYAVGDQRSDARAPVMQRHPDARIWIIRIGHIAAASFGGGDTREKK